MYILTSKLVILSPFADQIMFFWQYFRSSHIICFAKDLFLFYVKKDKMILVYFVRLEKTVTEMATGCLRKIESGHICVEQLKLYFS